MASQEVASVRELGERRDSAKRRRLSERRRILSRLAASQQRQPDATTGNMNSYSTAERSSAALDERLSGVTELAKSALGADHSKISMKIQFHIAVAPEDEPLIIERQPSQRLNSQRSSDSWIGEQIHERLASAGSRRRQHLVALHKQPALQIDQDQQQARQLYRRASTHQSMEEGADGRPAERSSTISGGMADEATLRFLARNERRSLGDSCAAELANEPSSAQELIYFKRDGQRFGHEFTLKLAVDRTYRCLIKLRPLLPLQSISIQGHQVLFVDCSQAKQQQQHTTSNSAPASSCALNRSWQNIHSLRPHPASAQSSTKHHPLSHALTSPSLARAAASGNKFKSQETLLFELQQSQMRRHFAGPHSSSVSSSPHLGAQLVYMFDWSASRFEVTKNKARTEVQTVLKFVNGQVLALPLQVKFYQPERKQHLNWGSQLHFIDYDCAMNKLGQMGVERIHYY